jgi:hypothetical protein
MALPRLALQPFHELVLAAPSGGGTASNVTLDGATTLAAGSTLRTSGAVRLGAEFLAVRPKLLWCPAQSAVSVG